MNEKFSKYIDLNIFEDLYDLENARYVLPFHGDLRLSFITNRVIEPNRHLPLDFIADYLEEVSSLYRELHEQRILSFDKLKDQELVS